MSKLEKTFVVTRTISIEVEIRSLASDVAHKKFEQQALAIADECFGVNNSRVQGNRLRDEMECCFSSLLRDDLCTPWQITDVTCVKESDESISHSTKNNLFYESRG